MKPKQLEYLEAIQTHGSITESARALDTTQSTISTAISNLENELDVSLVDRGNAAEPITEYGKCLLEYRANAIRQIKNASAEIREARGWSSTVRFANKTPLGNLSRIISNFQNAHPDIELVRTTPSEQSENIEYDLEFFASSKEQDAKNTHYICDEHYVLLVSEKHPLAKKDFVELKNLSREKFIVSSSTSEMNDIVRGMFKEAGFFPDPVIALPVFWDIMAMTEQGFGCCIATDITWICNTNLKLKALRILDTPRSRSLYLGFPSGAYISKATKVFANYLIDQIGSLRRKHDERFLY